VEADVALCRETRLRYSAGPGQAVMMIENAWLVSVTLVPLSV
jgi:hypothetical protein